MATTNIERHVNRDVQRQAHEKDEVPGRAALLADDAYAKHI